MERSEGTPNVDAGPLAVLQVIDRLEVGSPRIEPRRLSIPYRLLQQGQLDTFDLIYRYEEDVFNPQEPSSQNLAAVIGAQVALNYGLFCREIVFEGWLDELDQRFLEDMARNTAREIYVKKFLEPNPFLRGEVAQLPAVRLEDYLLAQLRFAAADGPKPEGVSGSSRERRLTERWTTERTRHAVLSSGGKDSLLSFGLLRELGLETHPIFVNESGRHWYTALNAYRHLSSSWPQTARVWTNSDRVFSWMLRHLPFIRSDFASVRSDEYPIRLWTVAVFLFGVLPLVRKRGIGRVVIGNEYDTTERRAHKEIPHYNGLFDQSRYFDNALSRYYRRKGWEISQFSIVRPLSELLIQKILVERYPQLQAQQVSCHATHVEGERVRPCGRCEKCRRIVAMLVAVDADPTACGYTQEQIQLCLRALQSRGLHQEQEGVQHLIWLLQVKQRLEPGADGIAGRERPEVLKLRIDAERSPLDLLPGDLRKPLFEIYLQHAAGAVRREGRVWVPLDLLQDRALSTPYPFEAAVAARRTAAASAPAADRAAQPKDYLLAELTWPQARARFRETDLALLPVGAIEQHGPHLPLDVDAWDADHLARRVAAACSEPRPLVLPLIPYGVSHNHDDFSGTLSVTPETLSRLVYEVGMAAARHGITKLVIINGHGGNVPTLQFAAQMINRDARIFTCVDTGDTSEAEVAKLVETPNDVHAGEVETSTTLATRPELVQMSKARKFVPRFFNQYLDASSASSVEWYAQTARISSSGVLGDPTRASREKGEKIWQLMIEHLVAFVESLKGLSLDEIHERRY